MKRSAARARSKIETHTKTSARAGTKRRFPRPKLRHAAVFGVLAMTGMTVSNAAFLQRERHPAPYFDEGERAVGTARTNETAGLTADRHVMALQSRLKATGHYDGPLDGLMGERTLASAFAALDAGAARAADRAAAPRATVVMRDVGEARTPLQRTPTPPTPRPSADAPDAITDLLTATSVEAPRSPVSAGLDPAGARPAAAVRQADPAVASVQRALAERGYEPGPVDGLMGSATRSALEAYQASQGLPVTGTADASVLAALGLGDA